MEDVGREEVERAPMKVKQISVGEFGNLVLTRDGCVYERVCLVVQ